MKRQVRNWKTQKPKARMKDTGIGYAHATRAAIIETLFSRQKYIIREKEPCPDRERLAVYKHHPGQENSGRRNDGHVENTLARYRKWEMNPDTFRKGIERCTQRSKSRLNFWMFSFCSLRLVVSARNARLTHSGLSESRKVFQCGLFLRYHFPQQERKTKRINRLPNW